MVAPEPGHPHAQQPQLPQPATQALRERLGATIPIGADGAQDCEVPAGTPGIAATLSAGPSACAAESGAAGGEEVVGLALAQRRILASGETLVAGAQERYEIQQVLGVGATGRVFAARDATLDRAIAIKALNAAVPSGPARALTSGTPTAARFLSEARIAAALAHPNILPVHDLDLAGDGTPFFTMPRVAGASLGALIAASSSGHRHAALPDVAAVVRVAIGVAQAMAYAHHRGIVHQDIKPDNILLGDFGEILLVDWGAALRLGEDQEGGLYGTPLYMSPEQARAERIDARADIYCLGATVFHALHLRPPTWSSTIEAFWERKRRGEIDEPDERERSEAPPGLRAIVRKAMAPKLADRYRDAQELLADLRAYQDGQSVSAHRESPIERFARWHRRRWRMLYFALAALAVVAALIALLVGDRLAEMASWGNPVYTEDFARPDPALWRPIKGAMAVRDGRLESQAGGDNSMLLDRRWQGDVAIEYDGRMLPGGEAGDVSLLWCRARELTPDGSRVSRLGGRYAVKIGAYYNTYTGIYHEDQVFAATPFRLQMDRTYHVRVEVVGTSISLAIDGKRLLTWHDALPVTGGYLCFLGEYPGKAFSHLRVWQRGVAARLPATAIGDALMERGDAAGAAEEYGRAAESLHGGAIADEAIYREGLCRWEQGDHAAARALWSVLVDSPHATAIRLRGLDDAFARGDHAAVRAGLLDVASHGGDDRHEAALAWGVDVNALLRGAGENPSAPIANECARYLEVYAQALRSEHAIDIIVADALLKLRRYDDVLAWVPTMRIQVAGALVAKGRLRDVIEGYRDCGWNFDRALWQSGAFTSLMPMDDSFITMQCQTQLGRLDAVYRMPECAGVDRAVLLTRMGRFDEALAHCRPNDDEVRGRIEAFQGRFARTRGPGSEFIALATGRLDLIDLRQVGPDMRALASLAARMERAIAGDAGALRPAHGDGPLEVLDGLDPNQPSEETYLAHFVARSIFPLLRAIGNEPQALSAVDDAVRARDRYEGMQRFAYDADLIMGRVDRAGYLLQPSRLYAEARAHLLLGLVAELHHRHDAARAEYRAYLAMPAWRRADFRYGALQDMVAWRLSGLGP